MNGSLCDFGGAWRVLVAFLLPVTILLLTLPGASTANADGPDTGTSRLLIAEMKAIRTNTGRLTGALAKPDFGTAASQASAISQNWPAVRDELERRDETVVASNFESAMSSLTAAVEAEDADAAAASALNLGSALNSVEAALGTVDVDGGRLINALLVPLLLIAAITVALPAIARKMEVKL